MVPHGQIEHKDVRLLRQEDSDRSLHLSESSAKEKEVLPSDACLPGRPVLFTHMLLLSKPTAEKKTHTHTHNFFQQMEVEADGLPDSASMLDPGGGLQVADLAIGLRFHLPGFQHGPSNDCNSKKWYQNGTLANKTKDKHPRNPNSLILSHTQRSLSFFRGLLFEWFFTWKTSGKNSEAKAILVDLRIL